MNCRPSLLSTLLFFGTIAPQQGLPNSVTIESSSGEELHVSIDSSDRFVDVVNRLQSYFEADIPLKSIHQDGAAIPAWTLSVSHAGLVMRAKQEGGRDYHAKLSKQQRDDIAFVVTTLAWDKWNVIWDKESKLHEAQGRIAGVHPLLFLEVIFTNDKLIAGVSAIKERDVPTVKRRFFKELASSLEDEANRGNLLQFVDEFADNLQISKRRILPALENKKYYDFIDVLIELKPREGADRHIM